MRWLARGAAAAVAWLAATASGVTIDYVAVGNPGNPANTNGWGTVAEAFMISKLETTNAQYVEFLNKVDTAGTNPNGIYNSQMASDALGGITFNAAAAAGSKYAVKPGAPPSSPAGTNYGAMPVDFVTWFSAARFANWLQNGQRADAASMERGSYQLDSQLSGTIVARSPGSGSQVVLPSRDEWYKSAFYNGIGYTLYPCNANNPMTNTVTNLTLPCAANFGGPDTPTVGPINVGSYVNSPSAYGLYDIFGNIAEYSDTAGTLSDASRVQVFGGSWATPVHDMMLWNSAAPPVFRSPTTATGQVGFRVAVVQAVPEPDVAVALGAVLGGLAACRRGARRPQSRGRRAGLASRPRPATAPPNRSRRRRA